MACPLLQKSRGNVPLFTHGFTPMHVELRDKPTPALYFSVRMVSAASNYVSSSSITQVPYDSVSVICGHRSELTTGHWVTKYHGWVTDHSYIVTNLRET